jgi:hypothetical protein
MSSTSTEVHKFHSLFAAQAFVATLRAAERSCRTLRVPRPKPGRHLYVVVVYHAA